MSNVRELIAQNRVKEAIQCLIDNNEDGAILLMGRFNSAEKDRLMGIVSHQEHSLALNRIIHAALSMTGRPTEAAYSPRNEGAKVGHDQSLLEIIAQNKRRRPEIAREAQAILNEIRAHNDTVAINPSHDPAGRRLKAIQGRAEALASRLREEKDDSLEAIVGRIAKLLEAGVPTYENLKEAFILASGRGMASRWVEDQLQRQPDDDETRILIAESIETFTASIQKA